MRGPRSRPSEELGSRPSEGPLREGGRGRARARARPMKGSIAIQPKKGSIARAIYSIYDSSTRPQTISLLAIIHMIIYDRGLSLYYLSICLYLSISLSLYLSISLSLYLSISLSLYLSISQEAPRTPRRLPEGSQEAPRRHPGGSQGTKGSKRLLREGRFILYWFLLPFLTKFLSFVTFTRGF